MTDTQLQDYLNYFSLKELPFAPTPDPHFLFPTEENQQALQGIYTCVKRGEGYAVLTGDIGTGKTLICRALLELFEKDNIETALLVNPFINEEELVRTLLNDFGVIQEHAAGDAAGGGGRPDVQQMMEQITDFLTRKAHEGKRCVAIIDEAQNLPISALEQLRIMGNLETNKEKLLQIILVGQNEFLDVLKHGRLMQLVQRISNWYRLGPMSKGVVGEYFRFRLQQAGLQKTLKLSPEALGTVYRLTGGYPRLMNILFDRTMREASMQRKWGIDDDDVVRASEGMPTIQDRRERGAGRAMARAGRLLQAAAIVTLLLLAGLGGFWLRGKQSGGDHQQGPAITPPTESTQLGKWNLQVGEFEVKHVAEASVRTALGSLEKATGKAARKGFVLTVDKGDKQVFLAVIGGFADADEAQFAAKVLERLGVEALPVDGQQLQKQIGAGP